jgi:hypothetical protein
MLDMSKAFDTVNTYKLTRKLLNTNIPHTILKFTANYLKGRKAYTTYNNTKSIQQQFKAGVPTPRRSTLADTLQHIHIRHSTCTPTSTH